MLGLLKMCYTCLGMNNNELTDVSKPDFDSITFLCKLRACVSAELEEDSLKKMCSSCITQLRISYRFRELALLSQKALDKHKSEIISGTYVVESKINQCRLSINNHVCEPEDFLVKKELANLDSPVNNTHRRRCKSEKNLLTEEPEQEYFSDIPMNNGSESDSSDYFLADIKSDKNQQQLSDNLQADTDVMDCAIKEIDDLPHEYQCSKCSFVLKDSEVEQHCCDGSDSCDNTDAKEQIRKSPKDEVTLKSRRGRPKNKIKNTKPDMEYECYHCSIIFNKRWKLRKHITRVHSESKKYVCTYCNKGFKQSYHLREHLTSHTGERNYTCSFCDKSFQRISSMRRHIRSHEAAPGQKTKRTPFLCTVCGKSFPFSNGVQRHMRIHLGIKNHECSVCHRKFTQSTHLHVHMRTHTGEKPYVCDTCGEAFSLNASLQKHMTIHQNIKRVNNTAPCNKGFSDNL